MNEKELPRSCALVIEVFCVCLALGVSFRFVSLFRCRRIIGYWVKVLGTGIKKEVTYAFSPSLPWTAREIFGQDYTATAA